MKFSPDRAIIGTVATSFAGQTTLVVSGVIVARVLGPEDRGFFAGFVLVSTIVAFFVSAGVPIAATLEIAADRRSVHGVVTDLRHVVYVQLLLSIAAPAVILVALYAGTEVMVAALFTVPLTASAIAFRYGLAFLQGRQKFALFNVLRAAPAVIYAFGVVLALLAGYDGLTQFAIIQTVAAVAGGALVLWYSFRGEEPDSSPSQGSRGLLKYGAKAQIGAVSPLEDLRLDQVAVGALLGPASLGIYVVAGAFTNLPRFVAQSLGMVLFPRVASRLGSGGKRRLVLESVVIAAVLCGLIVVALILCVGFLIPLFFGDSYMESIKIAQILLIAAFFLSMRRVIGDALRGADLPLPGTIAEVASWVVFAIAAVPLTIAYEEEGAALAMTISAGASLTVLGIHAFSIARGRRQAGVGA